jgi:hypothetical protein
MIGSIPPYRQGETMHAKLIAKGKEKKMIWLIGKN